MIWARFSRLQKTIASIAALIVSLGIIVGAWSTSGLWFPASTQAVNEVMEIAASNRQRIDEDRFFTLDKKRQSSVRLTDSEWREWCALGKRLRYFTECRR